jgi:hypothetical protein
MDKRKKMKDIENLKTKLHEMVDIIIEMQNLLYSLEERFVDDEERSIEWQKNYVAALGYKKEKEPEEGWKRICI